MWLENLLAAIILVLLIILIYLLTTKHPVRKKIRIPKQKHNNDSQNVHNSTIVKSIKKKYDRLIELKNNEVIDLGIDDNSIEENKEELAILQIRNYVKDLDDIKKIKIDCFLDSLHRNNKVVVLDDYDKHVLSMVWERIHDSSNVANLEKLKESLVDQILDSVNPYGPGYFPVCINGKVSRIISSLTLLDSDKILAAPEMDEKEIENLAYFRAYQILNENLKLQNIEKLYNTPEDDLSSEDRQKLYKFIEFCSNNIETEIRKEYSEVLRENELQRIIENAKQGI
jgi:hypothetical protein